MNELARKYMDILITTSLGSEDEIKASIKDLYSLVNMEAPETIYYTKGPDEAFRLAYLLLDDDLKQDKDNLKDWLKTVFDKSSETLTRFYAAQLVDGDTTSDNPEAFEEFKAAFDRIINSKSEKVFTKLQTLTAGVLTLDKACIVIERPKKVEVETGKLTVTWRSGEVTVHENGDL